MKRQVTITITVEDLRQYFGCGVVEAADIWDAIDEEFDIEETINEAAMGDFNILMFEYQWRNK